MRPSLKVIAGACLLLGAALLLASCETVNRLDRYSVEDATLAVDMRVPPEPTMKVGYSVTFDLHDPLVTVLSVGTNIAKAGEASEAEVRMREALQSVDVPAILLKEATSACAQALDARLEDRRIDADYLLNLDVHEYGIEADSPGGGVSLRLRLTASLYHNNSGELVWRRGIVVHKNASPSLFGLGDIVGNIVSAGALSDMSIEQMAAGFTRLAEDSARVVARTMEDDLYAARYDE
jgi:hypothetical protein